MTSTASESTIVGIPPEEVVHTHNVIAFFVWAWPPGFYDWSCSPWWATSWRGTLPYRRQKVGVPRGRLFPSGLCLSAISRVVWAWPDPLPTRLKRVGKNVQTLWWAELDRLHSMTRAHPPLRVVLQLQPKRPLWGSYRWHMVTLKKKRVFCFVTLFIHWSHSHS